MNRNDTQSEIALNILDTLIDANNVQDVERGHYLGHLDYEYETY